MKPLAGASVPKRSRSRQLLVTYRDGLDGSILSVVMVSARQPSPDKLLRRLDRELDGLQQCLADWLHDALAVTYFDAACTAFTMTYDGVVSRA